MQGSVRKPNWKRGSQWLLWWKIDPEELRRQVEGYDTLKRIETARWLGFILSLWIGVPTAVVGGILLWRNNFGWSLWCGAGATVEGLLFCGLGCFVYRGKQWALAGLMALWSLNIVATDSIPDHELLAELHLLWLPLASVVGWTVWMHVFYFALRVERARTRTGDASRVVRQC